MLIELSVYTIISLIVITFVFCKTTRFNTSKFDTHYPHSDDSNDQSFESNHSESDEIELQYN